LLSRAQTVDLGLQVRCAVVGIALHAIAGCSFGGVSLSTLAGAVIVAALKCGLQPVDLLPQRGRRLILLLGVLQLLRQRKNFVGKRPLLLVGGPLERLKLPRCVRCSSIRRALRISPCGQSPLGLGQVCGQLSRSVLCGPQLVLQCRLRTLTISCSRCSAIEGSRCASLSISSTTLGIGGPTGKVVALLGNSTQLRSCPVAILCQLPLSVAQLLCRGALGIACSSLALLSLLQRGRPGSDVPP
jgi:hypothetical protein